MLSPELSCVVGIISTELVPKKSTGSYLDVTSEMTCIYVCPCVEFFSSRIVAVEPHVNAHIELTSIHPLIGTYRRTVRTQSCTLTRVKQAQNEI
jgi:hypothetical protein